MSDQHEAAADSGLLNELVQQCADGWDASGPALVDEMCHRHPELAAAIRRRVGLLQKVGLLRQQPSTMPEKLGEFRLEGELGSGGMGVVFQAVQETLHRPVALKVIRPDHSFFEEARQRFKREVDAVARLQHRGIVPVHVVGEESGVLYYAMELVQGCTLSQVLEELAGRDPSTLASDELITAIRKRAPQGDEATTAHSFGRTWVECCLAMVKEIAEALDHAHSRGVLHRDVKPSNVMVTAAGRVMLLDFGLASTDSDPRITRSGTALGSLAYMAPEQVRGELDAIGRTTDVYGAGVLLYELLTLTAPYFAKTTEQIRQAILAGRPQPLRTRNAAVAGDAETVCLKAIDLDPACRYQTAADLARDLGNVLELRPIEARPPNLWMRTRRAAQRHPARALSVLFAVVLLVGVFPYLYWQQRSARLRLLEEKGRTDAALVTANDARVRAEAQEQRARWGLGKAREAVEHFLAEMGRFRAANIPLLEDFRRVTLQEAADLYQELLTAEEDPDSSPLNYDLGRALLGLGQVMSEQGRNKQAVPVMRGALAALQRHASGPDADREARRMVASAHSGLGAKLSQTADLVGAERHLQACRAILDELFAEQDEPLLRAMLVNSSVRLANLRDRQGDAEESRRLLDEAVEFAVGAERTPRLLLHLSLAHHNLGHLHSKASDTKAAMAAYETSVELKRELLAHDPGSGRYREDLAIALEGLASTITSWHDEEHDTSLPYFEEALAITSGLIGDFPRQPAFRVRHCRLLIQTAGVRAHLGQADGAERDYLAAIEGLERVRRELPQETDWRVPLGFARRALAGHYATHGRNEDARAQLDLGTELLEELLRDRPRQTNLLQNLAENEMARSMWRLVPPAERQQAARKAFDLGVRFLEEWPSNAQLRGSAFRAFVHLAEMLLDAGDPEPLLAVTDEYRDANPYKWQSQLTLARFYLRCRTLLADYPGHDDERRQALRQRCLDEARHAIQRGSEHKLSRVLRIEDDPEFAVLRDDPAVAQLLQRARTEKAAR